MGSIDKALRKIGIRKLIAFLLNIQLYFEFPKQKKDRH